MSDDICPICLEDIIHSFKKMICSHKFHNNCILEWKKYNSSCPICRCDLNEQKSEYFKQVIPSDNNNKIPKNITSEFNLYPEDYQPSGLKFIRMVNLLKVLSGSSGLAYE